MFLYWKKHRRNLNSLGDSLIDMNTARAAGVDFAAVTTGMTTVADFTAAGQYRILQNLSELI